MTLIIPQCYKCKHFKSYPTCAAFSDIPLEILLNKVKHTKPYTGDMGITFTPR